MLSQFSKDLRYLTGLGPIRLDAAVPLDPRDGDPNSPLCRKRTSVLTRIFLAVAVFFIDLPGFAQESEQADRSYFVGLLEDQLSGPNRQICIRACCLPTPRLAKSR